MKHTFMTYLTKKGSMTRYSNVSFLPCNFPTLAQR